MRNFAQTALLLLASFLLASSAFAFRNSIGFWRGGQFVDYIGSLFNQGISVGTTWDSSNNILRLSQTGSATDLELDPSWTPAWSNIMGYWKLDETSGTSFADSSGNNNTATMENGSPAFIAGPLNGAINFNGSSNALIADSTTLHVTTGWTVQAWVNQQAAPSGAGAVIFGDNFSGSTLQFCLGYCGSGESSVISAGVFPGNWYNSPTYTLANGSWVYLVGVYNGAAGTISLYVNGSLLGTTSGVPSTVAPSLEPKRIARRWDDADYFNGYVDDVAIWNVPLSASAVATIYQHESAKYAGTFTSRVMDGLAAGTSWASLAWTPTLPFFKELPDSGSSESSSNYPSQSSGLMNGNVGLWHFDDAGPSTAIDQSGNSNNGTGSAVTFGASGKLAGAVSFTSGANSLISVSSSSSLNISGAMTMSAWVNTTNSGHEVVMQKFGASNEGGYGMFLDSGHVWFTTNSTAAGWNDFVGNYYPMVNGGWYHVAAVYDGTMKYIYVNGVLDSSEGYNGYTIVTNNGNLAFGESFNQNWYAGSMDEAAIWNRALSATEIMELYRRGANRTNYQVRSCPDSSCSTNPNWLGPDGTSQTYFSELNNNVIPGAGADLTSSDSVQTAGPKMTFSNFGAPLITNLPTNRYFQYRAILESDDQGSGCNYGSGATWCSPEIQSVGMTP